MSIEHAARIIQDGGLVIFPTETVYGIGANAYNENACKNIFAAKGRPANNPLIVHVGSMAQAMALAEFNADAMKLAQLWPGPLTLVLPQQKKLQNQIYNPDPNTNDHAGDKMIASSVTAGLETIALRIPAEPIALALINLSQCPIAAPSANKSGLLTATTLEHVEHHFAQSIFTIKTPVMHTYGLESTIVDLSTQQVTILRPGYYTSEMLSDMLQKEVIYATKGSSVKAPGMMLRHYAPHTRLRINATDLMSNEIGLNFGSSQLLAEGSLNLSASGDLLEAAAQLYTCLHELDKYCQQHYVSSIAVAHILNQGIGIAINDRLIRAAESY